MYYEDIPAHCWRSLSKNTTQNKREEDLCIYAIYYVILY